MDTVHPPLKKSSVSYQVQAITPEGKHEYFMFTSNVRAFAKAEAIAKTSQYKRVYVIENDTRRIHSPVPIVFDVKGKGV